MNDTKVKVFSNLCDDVIEFETVEDFDNYYRKNKELIDKLSTRGLNQKFKIKNHHIGRLKNEITLYPLKDSKTKKDNVPTSLDYADSTGVTIHEKLNRLNERFKKIESLLTSLLDALFNEQNEPNSSTQSQFRNQANANTRFSTSYI